MIFSMAVIAPCITVETDEQYKEAVQRLKPFAQRVHIDTSDGEFAPTFLTPPEKMWWPENWQVDIHAMVQRPAEYVDRLIALKPNQITFHAEADGDLLAVLDKVKQARIKAGIALLRPTVPSTVKDLIEKSDHVLIFSGDLGHYGGKASLMQLEKIRLVRNISPQVEIGWDGGVSVDNVFTLSQGGVDVLNSGGGISNSDNPTATYQKKVRETNKKGIF